MDFTKEVQVLILFLTHPVASVMFLGLSQPLSPCLPASLRSSEVLLVETLLQTSKTVWLIVGRPPFLTEGDVTTGVQWLSGDHEATLKTKPHALNVPV